MATDAGVSVGASFLLILALPVLGLGLIGCIVYTVISGYGLGTCNSAFCGASIGMSIWFIKWVICILSFLPGTANGFIWMLFVVLSNFFAGYSDDGDDVFSAKNY